MPIYAYRCMSCGHAQDVLQKLSDPLLEVCPACGASTFVKQVTAAGFQLKGSGWYVTDFRGGNSGAKKDDAGGGTKTEPAAGADAASKPADKPAEAKAETKSADSKPAAPTPPASTPSP